MLYFAPLQGFTDYIFRRVFASNFGGIDTFFIPYISLNNKKPLHKQLTEVLPENNFQINVVPQILFKNEAEVHELSMVLNDLGYKRINLNLGCPYPMVTNRGMGSGLLSNADNLREIFSGCDRYPKINYSVKLRSGLTNENEIIPIIEILNMFQFSEVIYHPRLASQLYKGDVNYNLAARIIELSKNKIALNGDIFSLKNYLEKKQHFPQIENWMLGRGILKNPFLAEEINGKQTEGNEKLKRLWNFHEELLQYYSQKLSGEGHILIKMKQLWQYFSFVFEEQHKVQKAVKKAGSIQNYQKAVSEIFSGKFKTI
ncbi:MAG: tRNA-dihydrouridine synthase family protein [Prolixibacteraceae bacterium]|nr:tRNA-dihydrouridine synthase family protein [Prolixibacteraceae bacterium]MBN2775324.1 tRNA-dihydrouridine synthase family protein [Prolixibacteraceae bacterium]